jgi:hypothetical protein
MNFRGLGHPDQQFQYPDQQHQHHDRSRVAAFSTTEPGTQRSIQASPVMPVEKKDILPGNAQSKGIMPRSPTLMAATPTQPYDVATPITIRGRDR